jgi:hypothetical protein
MIEEITETFVTPDGEVEITETIVTFEEEGEEDNGFVEEDMAADAEESKEDD